MGAAVLVLLGCGGNDLTPTTTGDAGAEDGTTPDGGMAPDTSAGDGGNARPFRLASTGMQLLVSGASIGLQLTPANLGDDVDVASVHQEFYGVPWDAFAVMPSAEPRGLARLPEQYQNGWLCFESATEKRRLGPIPADWQTVSDEALRRFRDAAQPVTQRRSPEQRDQH